MKSSPARSTAILAAALLLSAPPRAAAQSTPQWNTARVLELLGRARELRESAKVDSAFQTYQARARGYVYFFFERPDTEDRTLVKADQVALDVYWRAPSQTRQRIQGIKRGIAFQHQ